MNRLSLCAAVASVLLCAGATAALAASPASEPATAAVSNPGKDAGQPDKLICKTTDVTGSRLGGTKTCLTRAQWDKVSRAGQDYTNDFTRNSDHLSPNGTMGMFGGGHGQ